MRISDWSSDVCSSDLLLEGVGKSARQLLRRGAHVGVRYFSDFFAPKLPAAKKTRNAGNGATSFHQDYITFAVDRTGGMTFWLALEDYGPEFGTMSFVNRSQNLGVIGRYDRKRVVSGQRGAVRGKR